MHLARKVGNVLRGLLQAYGTRSLKRYLWNTEFSRGRWDCLDRSPGDCVYPYVEKYANNGSILDLGCGSGSTGSELSATTYREYTGVDISDVAIGKAKRRTEEDGRAANNHYLQADISSYVPTQQFDVILFRDSIYYIPGKKIKPLMDRYSKYLKKEGVFLVRLYDSRGKYKRILDTFLNSFEVVEKYVSDESTAVIVFRQRYRL